MNKNSKINDELASLIRQYQGLVYSVIYGITLDADESWDITQEVFIKAFECSGFSSNTFNHKAWLVKVARNEALKKLRSFKSRFRYFIKFCGFEASSEANELENRLIHDENVIKLRELLKKLDDDDRQILTLRFNVEMSYQEIADEMALKLGTVMSRLSRLKEQLGIDFQED
ncbi:MAG: sigma-70 family RNA polymerase sigma factor [Candidatus Riflebacteria bacterium]|nr:sigma-70 family RNA polymerase sigma factor [Candidatus Riflebacteria bacterium]